MKSLRDSRLLIELGPWQLNTSCESPLELRTGYWMRHIKPLFTRNITGCIQALLNTHGFGNVWLNPFIASSSFHKLFKTHMDDQKQERRSKLLSSSRFDTLKYFIEDDRQESYIYKIRNHCIRKILIDWKSTRRFYQHAVSTKPLHLPVRCVPENYVSRVRPRDVKANGRCFRRNNRKTAPINLYFGRMSMLGKPGFASNSAIFSAVNNYVTTSRGLTRDT